LNTSARKKGRESWGSAWRREGSRDTLLHPFDTSRGPTRKMERLHWLRDGSDKTRGNNFKEGRFILGIRRRLFTMRVVRHLPR